MSQINIDPAAKNPLGSLVNQVFINKLERIKKYLSNIICQDKDHDLLIQKLESLRLEAISHHIRVIIVGRQEELVGKVKLANQNCSTLNSFSEFTSLTFPCNINSLFKSCDFIFLVINSDRESIPVEKEIFFKAKEANISLIIIDFNPAPIPIESWLEDKNLFSLTYFNLSHKFSEKSQSLLIAQECDNFLQSLLSQLSLKIETDLDTKLIKIVSKYFIQYKSQYLEEIRQHRKQYFSGKSTQEIKESINQLQVSYNNILSRKFRKIKKTFQESKQDLVNPFVSTSFIYHIQQVINESTVIQHRENNKIYLDLVITKDRSRQAIHSHILEIYQQKINLWIEEKWAILDPEINFFNKFKDQGDRELQILKNLTNTEIKLSIVPKPTFDLNKYICLSAVTKMNRVIFDYHYTQSTWFRMTVAIAVGLVLFFLTDRLFGFILLFVQIVNLLTGQSSKSLKLKQQTKELKKSVSNKYQNLVKFVADKLIQDIDIFLDRQSQLYQDRVNSYIQDSEKRVTNIKQKITQNQNKISELSKIQQEIMQIIKEI